jgi:hypothetical protein
VSLPNVRDTDDLVGRAAELATIDRALSRSRAGFLLMTGPPRMGKARMLGEVRRRAAARGYAVVPEHRPDGSQGVTIDSRTTVEQFSHSISTANDRMAAERSGASLGLAVVLIQGYHPTNWVDEWFREEFLPSLKTAAPPRLVVLTGYDADTARLAPFADYRIELGPLPVDEVRAWLASLSSALSEPLSELEMNEYAEAVSRAPGQLPGLRSVLTLPEDSDLDSVAVPEAGGFS